MSDKNELGIIASLDQADTGLENQARLVGNYYKYLLDAGIPEAFARELTRQLHEVFMNTRNRGGMMRRSDWLKLPYHIVSALCVASIVAYPWLVLMGAVSFHPLHLLALVLWMFLAAWVREL